MLRELVVKVRGCGEESELLLGSSGFQSPVLHPQACVFRCPRSKFPVLTLVVICVAGQHTLVKV